MTQPRPVRTLHDLAPGELPLAALLADGEPVVLKGIARDWALVQAGLGSSAQAMAYLRRFDAGVPLQYSHVPAEMGGRPFYNEDFTQLNFEVRRGLLTQVLDALEDALHSATPALACPARASMHPPASGSAIVSLHPAITTAPTTWPAAR